MTNPITNYFSTAANLLQQVAETSGEAIYQAADAIATALQNDKDYLVFGSGHSAFVAQDAFWRAGGLAPVIYVEDIAHGEAERVEGIAAITLSHYPLQAGSVMVVISNSGINPGPVEIAMLSKEAGLTVVAITSLKHSQSAPSRHSSGKKLYQAADIVIDNLGDPGDAAIDVPGYDLKCGATSSVVGCGIIQSITVQVATLLAERGIEPPILTSANVPQGDVRNEVLRQRYQPRMVRYQIANPTKRKLKS
ncbi:MAG: SIS domain-containing protein [Anaerolineae bacterium]